MSVSSTYTGTAALPTDGIKVNGSNVELGTSTASTFTLTPSNVNYEGSGDYMVLAELSGCTSSLMSAATTVSVISPADLIISTSTSNFETCSGYSLTLSDLNIQPQTEPTGYTQTWYYQEPGSSAWTTFTPSSGLPLTNSTTSNVLYSVKVEDKHDLEGCTAESNAASVTVYPVPTAPTISFDNTTSSRVTFYVARAQNQLQLARQQLVLLSVFKWYYSANNSTYSSTAAQVVGLNAQTNTGSVAIGTSTYSGTTLITDGQGYYKASVIDANGCESALSAPLEVIHEDLPKPLLSVNDNIVCDGTSIVLSASSSHSLSGNLTYSGTREAAQYLSLHPLHQLAISR